MPNLLLLAAGILVLAGVVAVAVEFVRMTRDERAAELACWAFVIAFLLWAGLRAWP